MTYNSIHERAIITVNGESLFASIEQAKHKQYKGKPLAVVTVKGVLLSLSAEARKLGVTMNISLKEMKKLFPQVIIIMRDAKGYLRYEVRIVKILKRYTQEVEESGSGVYFADVTGLRTLLKMTYKEIGERVVNDIRKDLGISLPTALSTSCVLSHFGSKWGESRELRIVNTKNATKMLKEFFVEDIWNISGNTIAYLNKLRIYSAYDLMKLPLATVEKVFQKPILELWKELHGISVWHDLPLGENDIDYNPTHVKPYHSYDKQHRTSISNITSTLEKLYARMTGTNATPLALQMFEERIKRHLVVPYIGKVS
jgi:nucleotidyltransferase/DNA polymerase involved in DNA repair